MKKKGFTLIAVLLLSMMLSLTAFAQSGWKTEGNQKYYYNEDGTMQKGWLTVGENRYYFHRKTGVMFTGIRKIQGMTYVFGEDGVLQKVYPKAGPKRQWLTVNGRTYYFDKKGYALTGWKKVSGTTYYFSKKGVLQTSKWVKYKSKQMYLDTDGKIAKNTWIGDKYVGEDGNYIADYRDDRRTNKNKTGWVGYGDQWKYYKKNKMVTGWKTINKKRYFFDSTGLMHTGWLQVKNQTYFMDTRTDTRGEMMTGWCKISNKYYYFFRSKTKANGTTYPKGSAAKGISIRFTLTDGTKKIYTFDKDGACTNY